MNDHRYRSKRIAAHPLLLLLALPLFALIVSQQCARATEPPITAMYKPTIIVNTDTILAYAMDDLDLSFHLQASDVHLHVGVGSSTVNALALFAGSIDAGVISGPLTAQQRTRYPTVRAFPFAATAIVPIYRLDALPNDAPDLVFTRNALVGIFTGAVRTWNDPAIALANPTVRLPNTTITVVLPDPTRDKSTTLVFTTALREFNSTALTFAPATAPNWPYSNYASYHIVTPSKQIDAVATYVLTTDATISYTWLAAALAVGVNIGDMFNSAGSKVKASNTSVGFAVIELGAQSLQSGASSDVMNLIDATGPLAWPINVASFFLVDLENSRDTCVSRFELVQFLIFVYESLLVRRIFARHSYSLMPDIVISALQIKHHLLNNVLCKGESAVPTSSSLDVAINVVPHMQLMMDLFTSVYGGLHTEVEYRTTPNWSSPSFNQLASSEIDVAMFFAHEIDPTTLAYAYASNEYAILPMMLMSVVPMFNLMLAPGIHVGALQNQLHLDARTIVYIQARRITDWRDPRILMWNPEFELLLTNLTGTTSNMTAPLPITVVRACGTHRMLSYHTSTVFRRFAERFDRDLLTAIDEMDAMPARYGVEGCTRPKLVDNIYWAPDELVLFSIVTSIVGGFGFVQDNIPGDVVNYQIRLWWPRSVMNADGSIAESKLFEAWSSDTMIGACIDAFDYTSLTLNVDQSRSPTCWPLALVVYVASRISFRSDTVGAMSCNRGVRTIGMMNWLTSTDDLSTTAVERIVMRPSIEESIKVAFLERLNSSTCDGEPLLYVQPFTWTVSEGVTAFANAAASIGIAYCIISIVLVMKFREHSVIRSASPIFLAMSLFGIVLLFISALFWVRSPTPASCGAFAWTLDLGFVFTFAPLFAKTWRIYAIFGRKKLRVVRITNTRLAIGVLVGVVLDMLMLIAWQIVAPIHPITRVMLTSSAPKSWQELNTRQNLYEQCGVEAGAGTGFLQFLLVTKALLLLFGAIMAFSTRKVKSTFNESQSITWSIYNVCFTAGIVLPIIVFLDQVGDVLVVLLLLLMLWIGFFSAGMLTGAKFGLVLKLVKPENENGLVSASSMGGAGGQFSFMSFASISSPAMMQSYIKALEDHLTAAKQHLRRIGPTEMSVSRRPTDGNWKPAALTRANTNISLVGAGRHTSLPGNTESMDVVGSGGGGGAGLVTGRAAYSVITSSSDDADTAGDTGTQKIVVRSLDIDGGAAATTAAVHTASTHSLGTVPKLALDSSSTRGISSISVAVRNVPAQTHGVTATTTNRRTSRAGAPPLTTPSSVVSSTGSHRSDEDV